MKNTLGGTLGHITFRLKFLVEITFRLQVVEATDESVTLWLRWKPHKSITLGDTVKSPTIWGSILVSTTS